MMYAPWKIPARWSAPCERAAFILFTVILVWAPFPLGSNRPWSWSLLALLIAVCWMFWLVAMQERPEKSWALLKRIFVPALLVAAVLAWTWVQTFSLTPGNWHHPIWQMSSSVLGEGISGAVSVDPWATLTALMKLVAYVATFWLAYALCMRPERASALLATLVTTGGVYMIYALILISTGFRQFELFYSGPAVGRPVAGPFVHDNNFATYAGLILLCALVRAFSLGAETVVATRGAGRFVSTFVPFLRGRGAIPVLTAVLSFSLLVATGSRAGFASVIVALLITGAFALRLVRGRMKARGIASGIGVALAALVLFEMSGAALRERFADFFASGELDTSRTILWSAALRMIGDAPLGGLGLGTFEAAYPLYASRFLPFAIDRAHNDYLELALGWGVPATALWLLAILGLVAMCARGVLQRGRNRAYALLAIGASAFIGFHSAFDFGMQIPAIAVTYAAILGMGVSQAFPAGRREPLDRAGPPDPTER